MRSDMSKVLCEKPRYGGVKEKGLSKNLSKQMSNDGETAIKSQSNSRKRKYNRKEFGEHLGPLKGFILSCVGRKWDDIYSEICSHINPSNLVQKHILTHIWDYVEKDVYLKDGQVYPSKPNRYNRIYSLTYIHPETGVLCKAPDRKRHIRNKWPDFKKLFLAGEKHCFVLDDDGIWWECWLQEPPKPTLKKHLIIGTKSFIYRQVSEKVYDQHLKTYTQDGASVLLKIYGKNLFCYKRKQINKAQIRKIKRHGLDKTQKRDMM